MVGAGNSSFQNDEPMVGAGNDEPKEKAIINANRRWPARYQYGKGEKRGMGGWNSWTGHGNGRGMGGWNSWTGHGNGRGMGGWNSWTQHGNGGKRGMGGWNSWTRHGNGRGKGGWNSWTRTKDHGGWSNESREPGGSWGNKHQDPCDGVLCTGIKGKVKGGEPKWEPTTTTTTTTKRPNRPWERRNHDDNWTNRGRRRGSDVGSCCNVIQTINLK